MKRSDALSSVSRNLQAEVGVGMTEISGVPAYNPMEETMEKKEVCSSPSGTLDSPFIEGAVVESIFPIHDESGWVICKSCGQRYASWNIYDIRSQHKRRGGDMGGWSMLCLKCQRISGFYPQELLAGYYGPDSPVDPDPGLSVFRNASCLPSTIGGHLKCLACSHPFSGFTVKGTLALLGRSDKTTTWIACAHCKEVSEYGVAQLIAALPESPVKKLSVGEKIEGKPIVEVHEGGMGIVYVCQGDMGLIAIKTLRPEISRHPQAEARFIREAEAWIRLGKHQNIVEATGLAFDKGFSTIQMEFQPISLANLLGKGRLTMSEIVEFARDFCNGMEHARIKIPEFVHRDIKPANCLVGSDGRLRISDFGLAKIMDDIPGTEGIEDKSQSAATKYQTNASRSAMGTLPYMAPEQFRAFSSADVRSDVYSFGVMLYEMITGKLPIVPEMATFSAWRDAHFNQRANPPTIQGSTIWESLSKVAMRCLEKDPDARPQHFGEVLNALPSISSQGPTPPQGRMSFNPDICVPEAKDESIYDLNLIQPFNLAQVGMHAEALAYAEKIVRVASRSNHSEAAIVQARGHALRAMVLVQLEKVRDAESAAEDSLGLNPDDSLALYEAGWCANHTGDFQKAISYLEKSFFLDPQRPRIHFELGFAYNATGDYRRAIKLLSEALVIQGEDFLLHKEIAYSFAQVNKDQEAISHYEKSARLCRADSRSERADISAKLSTLYSRNGDREKAQFNWEQALELAPRGSAIYLSLFRIEGATQLEEAAVENILHREGPWFKYHLPYLSVARREFSDRYTSTFFTYSRDEITSGPQNVSHYYLGHTISIEIEGLKGVASAQLLIHEGKLRMLQIYGDHSLPWPFENPRFRIN